MEAAWGPVQTLSDPLASFQNVGVDNFCRAVATWQRVDDFPSDNVTHVESAFLPQGGTWTTTVPVADTASGSCTYSIPYCCC